MYDEFLDCLHSNQYVRIYLKDIQILGQLIMFPNENLCCGHSKEPSHRDGSFEYLQHMIWLSLEKLIHLFRRDPGFLERRFIISGV